MDSSVRPLPSPNAEGTVPSGFTGPSSPLRRSSSSSPDRVPETPTEGLALEQAMGELVTQLDASVTSAKFPRISQGSQLNRYQYITAFVKGDIQFEETVEGISPETFESLSTGQRRDVLIAYFNKSNLSNDDKKELFIEGVKEKGCLGALQAFLAPDGFGGYDGESFLLESALQSSNNDAKSNGSVFGRQGNKIRSFNSTDVNFEATRPLALPKASEGFFSGAKRFACSLGADFHNGFLNFFKSCFTIDTENFEKGLTSQVLNLFSNCDTIGRVAGTIITRTSVPYVSGGFGLIFRAVVSLSCAVAGYTAFFGIAAVATIATYVAKAVVGSFIVLAFVALAVTLAGLYITAQTVATLVLDPISWPLYLIALGLGVPQLKEEVKYLRREVAQLRQIPLEDEKEKSWLEKNLVFTAFVWNNTLGRFFNKGSPQSGFSGVQAPTDPRGLPVPRFGEESSLLESTDGVVPSWSRSRAASTAPLSSGAWDSSGLDEIGETRGLQAAGQSLPLGGRAGSRPLAPRATATAAGSEGVADIEWS